jgi:hypothetical protein
MSESHNYSTPNKHSLENNNEWTEVTSRLRNRFSRMTDQIIDVQTVEVKPNRFVRGLSQLNDVQNNTQSRKTDMNGRNMSIFYKLNEEQAEIQKQRDEHRELMQRYMYRRPKETPVKKLEYIQPDSIDVSNPSAFPDLLGKPVQVINKQTESSLSSVFDELVIDVKTESNPWKNKNIKSIMEKNKDKKVSSIIPNKPKAETVDITDSVHIMVEFTPLYDDLLKNIPIEEEHDEDQQPLIDNDGFTRVIKTKKQKKSLY